MVFGFEEPPEMCPNILNCYPPNHTDIFVQFAAS